MQSEKNMSQEGVEKLTKLLASGEALRWIREFEVYRSDLAKVGEQDRPDKRTTVFVDAADLVWAWISEPGDKGFRSYAEELISCELAGEGLACTELASRWPGSEMAVLSQVVDQWEFSHPPFVKMVDDNGGITR